jgi:hypothetical protein
VKPRKQRDEPPRKQRDAEEEEDIELIDFELIEGEEEDMFVEKKMMSYVSPRMI